MGVTIKQLAQEAGLSWPAVSQILNRRGRFAPETRKRVLALAEERGYRPHASALALRNQSARMVGVLFRNDAGNPLTNMTAFEYLLGINQRFQDADYGTLLIRAGELAASDVEPRVFRERLVDGVIVVGNMPDGLIDRVRTLAHRVIWLDAPVWEAACCVRRDEQAAGAACANAVAGLGYKSVVFLSRSPNRQNHHSQPAREAGARAAAKAARLKFRTVAWPEDDAVQEFSLLHELLGTSAADTGLIAGTLPVTRRLVHSAAGLGKVPGYDFGLVCCDDSFETQVGWPALSRMGFDRYHLGEAAGDMMLRLLKTPDDPPASLLAASQWQPGCTAWGPRPLGGPGALPR